MIPARRLVLLALVPVLLALVWVGVPAVAPAIVAVDLLIVAVAAVDAVRNRARVRVRRAHGDLQGVGEDFPVVLSVWNEGGRPLTLLVGDDAPGVADGLPATLALAAGEGAQITYTCTIHGRGRHRFGAAAVRWSSPWGLWHRQERRAPEGDDVVRVYPDFSFLRQHGLKARLDERRMPVRARRRVGGESEFQRLRQYVAGDAYRHIDWKATARRGRYITREYGQESNQNVVFLIDAGRGATHRLGDLTAFDHALNAALAMGHAALRHGDRVGLLAFDHRVRAWLPPKGGVRSGARLVQGTYDVFPSHSEPDYAQAFRHLSSAVRRRSLVVLLTTVTDQVNADAAAAITRAMAGRHLPIVVWLRDPRLDTRLVTPAATAHDRYQQCAAAELVHWREQALADLRRRGALVVDCAPEALSGELLSRYLEVKARRLL